MATQIFGREHVVGFRRRAAAARRVGEEVPTITRSPFRGLFYVILFDAVLLVAGFGAWELWRHLR